MEALIGRCVGVCVCVKEYNTLPSGVTGRGAECNPETFHREIFGDLSGKMRQEKKVKNGKYRWKSGKMENEEQWEKMKKGWRKMRNVRGKNLMTFFFFFFFFAFHF